MINCGVFICHHRLLLHTYRHTYVFTEKKHLFQQSSGDCDDAAVLYFKIQSKGGQVALETVSSVVFVCVPVLTE